MPVTPRPPAHPTGSNAPGPQLHSVPRDSNGTQAHPQGLSPKHELKHQLPMAEAQAALNAPLQLLPILPLNIPFSPKELRRTLIFSRHF